MTAQDRPLGGEHQAAAAKHAQEVLHLAGIEHDVVEHDHGPHLPQELRALLGRELYGRI
jgi:hypothetical protein